MANIIIGAVGIVRVGVLVIFMTTVLLPVYGEHDYCEDASEIVERCAANFHQQTTGNFSSDCSHGIVQQYVNCLGEAGECIQLVQTTEGVLDYEYGHGNGGEKEEYAEIQADPIEKRGIQGPSSENGMLSMKRQAQGPPGPPPGADCRFDIECSERCGCFRCPRECIYMRCRGVLICPRTKRDDDTVNKDENNVCDIANPSSRGIEQSTGSASHLKPAIFSASVLLTTAVATYTYF